ncbi:MAG: InlB B-repeat-containing protein [Peptococcaceae bacterium]|nr:InlB B-repeat-containing protein [Peptococcaceae bacterium]
MKIKTPWLVFMASFVFALFLSALFIVPNAYAVDYQVTYNFAENKGTSATKTTDLFNSGAVVPLTGPAAPEATKTGWTFVGWNTNKDATTGLASFTMPSSNTTLYAIYKKELTVTLMDFDTDGVTKRTHPVSTTIYNKESGGTVTLPLPGISNNAVTSGYKALGWNAAGVTSLAGLIPPGSLTIDKDISLYGLYEGDIALTFDTKGGTPVPPIPGKIYSCCAPWVTWHGTPVLTLPPAPERQNYNFVAWVDPWGTRFEAGHVFSAERNGMSQSRLFTAEWIRETPADEDTTQYLAVHKVDPVTSAPKNYWSLNTPSSFLDPDSWDEITNELGTGNADRRMAIGFTFFYNATTQVEGKVVTSIRNMMDMALEKDVPIFIHLDGASDWYYTDLWNWWIPDGDPRLHPTWLGDAYNEENYKNVEHFGWGMEKATALKISWRNWSPTGDISGQRRVIPPPNLASEAFRQKDRDALSQIIPVIADWYNNTLPNDKKYLLAGVVLGCEVSPYAGAYYYHYVNDDGQLLNGNDYWDDGGMYYWDWNQETRDNDIARGLVGTPYNSTTVPLGYAAAETLRQQGHDIQSEGKIQPDTIAYIVTDYLDFLIGTTLDYGNGIPRDKLITHALYAEGHPQKAAISKKFEGVMPGWTTSSGLYGTLSTGVMEGRPWAAIEFNPNNMTAASLNAVFNHGDCRHINIKQWETIKDKPAYIQAIKTTLGG